MGVSAKSKAKSAARAQSQGKNLKKKAKIHTSVHWKKPYTKHHRKQPAFPKFALEGKPKVNKFSVLKYPLNTEVAVRKIENDNTLIFIVDNRANKPGIKNAFIRLPADEDALSVASNIGIL